MPKDLRGLFASGVFDTAAGVPVNNIARWDGSTWAPLGTGLNPPAVLALTTLPNGHLIAGGSFAPVGGAPAYNVARWDGGVWSPLGTGVNIQTYALTALPNGDLVAAGFSIAVGPGFSANRIARYEPCLAFHTAYGTGCDSPAMTLSASPNPVSTPTTGTTITYSIDNIPDATGSSNVHVGATIVSFGGDIPGTDLGFLGAPGCRLHVASLALMEAFAQTSGSMSNTTMLAIPPGVPPGASVYAQVVALTVPGLLNAAGYTTSNGVQSLIYAN